MRSQVPKFGNWESEENVPYTAYFDNARKNKNGEKMNPNDPLENPSMFSESRSPIRAPSEHAPMRDQKGPGTVRTKHERRVSREDNELGKLSDSPLEADISHQRHGGGVKSGSSKSESESPRVPDALRPKHERHVSRDEGDFRKQTDSPSRYDNVGRRATIDSPLHRHGGSSAGDTPKRVTRQSVGSDRSTEQSPLHPHYQARVGGRGSGVASPSWERKVSSEGSHGPAPSTPGRSRLRSVNRGDETPDNSPAVPKFGDWDESDPASAEGYTHIFNRVREEKQSGAGKVPVMPSENSYSSGPKHYRNENSKGCGCFPWGGK